MKRFAPAKVNKRALISKVKQGFKIVLKRPALRNLILVMLASLRTTTFRINTLAAHLPVLVAHYKTKQKRLLRFINSNFPTDVALVAWCRFVLCWLYNKIGQAPRIVLVDETDILEHYRVIVMAVPFRKRAIPIYWKIYRKDAFDKMVYRSHNALVQEFCCEFIKHFENALPNVRRPILVFDRGFARAKYLMKPFMEAGIEFVIRVCKNTCFYHNSQRIKLETLQKTGAYPSISYHSTEKLKLNLYVFKDARHKEPLYLVSNSLRNTQLYLTYKRRMQIEECFRDIKTLFGFRQLRLKRQELPRVALLWFLVCVSYAICFLHFEKSAERWIRAYNTRSTKTYSLIFVIKRILETTWNLTSSLTHIFRFPIVQAEARVSPVLISSHKISKKPYVPSLQKKTGGKSDIFYSIKDFFGYEYKEGRGFVAPELDGVSDKLYFEKKVNFSIGFVENR